MKEMVKQKMLNRLHRRNSSSSSTASVDYTSGEKLQFKFSGLQALQVPKGWDKLSLSIISVVTGKTIAKTGRSSAQNGICQWTENLSEYIWVPNGDASKGIEQCLYKLLISMGSGRSGILGEVTVNLSGHLSCETSTSIAEPLKNCSHGTILRVEIQCLTPRTNLRNDRWADTDSFTENANALDDLDATSDVSDGRIAKSVESSMSSNFMYTSQAAGLGNRDRSSSAGGSHSSFDSMDDSFGREVCSPHRNLSEAANALIGRQDSIGSSNSAQNSYDSPKSSHSPYRSGSVMHNLSQRQDSGKLSHSIPASPLKTFHSTEFVLETEGATMEELRAESRMWERNARKLKVDLDFSRKESRDQTRKLQNATMEVMAMQTECDGMKHEINYLKGLLDESQVKEKDADSSKFQVQDKDDIYTELEEEMKFQRDLNDDLSLQLNKTQESNLELVSILQELEVTIEKQRLEIESKCVELEANMVNIRGFKDKSCYLDGELNKYREIAEEQENEVVALKELLKLQQEEHENSFTGDSGVLEKLNLELKSRVEDLVKELLVKTSELQIFKSDCLLKDKEIERLNCNQTDLETQLSDLKILKSQLMGGLKAMQSESTIISECLDKVKTDMVVLNGTKDSHIAANKILEKKLSELESCNKELELHLSELEVENLHLSERISGLEPQLRYLTDSRESSRLEKQLSEIRVVNLQAEITRLKEEIDTSKVDTRQKLQDMQNRWLEAQEECEYLKKANPKLQNTAENLIEDCSQLQKSNRELKQQRIDLYNRCTVLEAELRESQHNFSKLSKNLKNLEDKFSLMINEIAAKKNLFDSELEALHLQNQEHTEKLVLGENLFNQMYSEKMVEIENLQQVAHLNELIYSSHDERDRMASEAVLEMHALRADKHKLEKSIEDFAERCRSSETVQVEYEAKIHDLTVEIAASKENHAVLVTNHEKLMELVENTRSKEEKLRITVGELDSNLKDCEFRRVQLTEEILSLKYQLQKIPLLQDEVMALKNSYNDVKYGNERLEASLQLITDDYKELKEEKTSLFQKTFSMQKAMIELEDHKCKKFGLEEQILRLQGDLTAREALCAQDAELKNELGRLKRSNSQLQWKINSLQEEKDECMKNAQVLEQKLEQKNDLEPEEKDSSLHKHMKLSEDVEARIQSLENELVKALEANDMYKDQIKSFLFEGQVHQLDVPQEFQTVNKEHDKDASLLETELKELQERYLHMSLKYAEVEAQREELVSKLKAARPGRSWFS